ncbi:hypothetical protein [Novosphingobium arvoryzae]|uniref:hypothetical protein n=1 Tax=Novosphingobium arvoryzae TaxID=1256514 RepID=UPI0016757CBF|nr:hypothetical protein [Novosphingobium arvoryzae]
MTQGHRRNYTTLTDATGSYCCKTECDRGYALFDRLIKNHMLPKAKRTEIEETTMQPMWCAFHLEFFAKLMLLVTIEIIPKNITPIIGSRSPSQGIFAQLSKSTSDKAAEMTSIQMLEFSIL